jgi:TrmH family RNA methyltransferase
MIDLHISSPQNERLKRLIRLQAKPKERKSSGLFVIEGLKEIAFALQCGYAVEEVFFAASQTPAVEHEIGHLLPKSTKVFSLSNEAFEKLAYREDSSAAVAIAQAKPYTLEQLPLSERPLILVAEGMEKPGNFGALLRTADAAKVDAVILCDSPIDQYNPNAIRSSVGCIFSMPVAVCSTEEAIQFLKNKGIRILVTHLKASLPYFTQNYKGPSAIVVGAEAWGVTDAWAKASDQNIIIPMQGINDSLNVSVAAAVVVFEAVRQRSMATSSLPETP